MLEEVAGHADVDGRLFLVARQHPDLRKGGREGGLSGGKEGGREGGKGGRNVP